jgi:RND family efflux transporter MFP subunit
MTPDPVGGPDLSGLRIDASKREDSRPGRGRLALVLVAVVVAVVVGGGVALRGRTVEVEVAAVRSGGSSGPAALLNASGYVTPRRRATVASKITARVIEIQVEEGLQVSEGQVLARLDESDARARLRAAQTARDATAAMIANLDVNLANAERELKRQQDLEREGVASVQALDLARTTAQSLQAQIAATREQVVAADAQIAVARQDLENCTVRAPFAGIAVSKDAQVGEMVSPISAGGGFTRTGISTIVDMASLEIEVDVNESNIAKVTAGQRVDAVLDAYPDWHIPSRVRTVIPTADRQKATVKVRISFDALDPRILPDMGVKVSFLGEGRPGGTESVTTLVPTAAVRQVDGKQAVFVFRDGAVERRAVTIGGSRGADTDVLAGVSPGEQVVTAGPETLHDGQKVRLKS